ncbi:3-hydroxyacyl-CoA dehydrogenase family protein [Thalassobius sp. S69A]|uniref:3-hydroxyacyl-CoA dehydrogenase family protein n=1 Tax=unclassified Thalassovita TaxID=2619711 RepID=UPI000C11A341|nr:hypothetical protein [Paracoccaceae bacterium]MBT26491.1 hypothetical protein [Paracoccaceae bacterium]
MKIPLISDLDDVTRARNRAHVAGLGRPAGALELSGKIGVVGGAAGLGLAVQVAQSGLDAVFLEEDAASLERATFFLTRNMQGRIPKNVRLTARLDDLTECAVIVDCGAGPLDEKAALLQKITAKAPQADLFMVNLAGADLSALRAQTTHPARLLGANHGAGILELAGADEATEYAVASANALAARLGRCVLRAPALGFVSQRLQMHMLDVADLLLLEGATPWDIDEALELFGFAMGPYEAQDLIGTDVAYALRQRRQPDPARRYSLIADRAVQEGRLGKKAGVGWYRYPGGGGKVIDPLVEDLCREEAYFAGVATRVFDADTLRLRILLALMNEAGWMVENGVAPADLDLISVRVLGVPADCGGIATFADQLGAQNILRALRVLQQEDPAMWRPAPCFAAEG